jgi:hypothetical protein
VVLPAAPAALSVGSQVKSVDNSVSYQGDGGNIPLANVGAASQLTASETANASPSWSTPIAILQDNNLVGGLGGPSMVIDQSGQWNVVYEDETVTQLSNAVQVDDSINYLHQGAAAPVTIAEGQTSYNDSTGTGTGTFLRSPSIAINAAGGLYVTFFEYTYTGTGDTVNTSLMYTNDLSASTTTLASSLNPSGYGGAVTFTATVNAVTTGDGTPTGTVTFMDGSTKLGSGSLSTAKGVTTATFTTNNLAAGSHTITAIYSGDQSFSTSTSAPLTQTVNDAKTTMVLSLSPTSSVYGQALSGEVTVSAVGNASEIPTGTVTVMDGTKALVTLNLSTTGLDAFADFSISGLNVGTHSIKAVYSGDNNFETNTSSVVTEVVAKANSAVRVASSVNPSTPGENITFTATVNVSSPGVGTPTGIVTFKDGTKTLGTATLTNVKGVMTATFSISGLAVGSHKITAVYGGDGNFNGSTSPVVTQTVAKAAKSVAKVAKSVAKVAKSVAPSVHDLALLSLIGGRQPLLLD